MGSPSRHRPRGSPPDHVYTTIDATSQDVDTVSEAIQQGAGESLRAEDLGPLVEGQVGGDQDRPSLVSLAEDLEEELRAGLGEWYEAQLVDDEQLEPCQILL